MCLHREGGKSEMVHLPSERRPGGKAAKKVSEQKLLKEGGEQDDKSCRPRREWGLDNKTVRQELCSGDDARSVGESSCH